MGNIAPIKGMLRKKLMLDLTASLGVGIALASWYWHGHHLRKIAQRDAYYAKLRLEKPELFQ